MSQTDIEAAVGQEEQQRHWLLLDDKLKREWSVLDPTNELSTDVLTYVSVLSHNCAVTAACHIAEYMYADLRNRSNSRNIRQRTNTH
jgi:hypothetical protein